jgi:hypothetical protein
MNVKGQLSRGTGGGKEKRLRGEENQSTLHIQI